MANYKMQVANYFLNILNNEYQLNKASAFCIVDQTPQASGADT